MKEQIVFGTAGQGECREAAELVQSCIPDAPAEYFEARIRGAIPGGALVARDGDRIVSNVSVLGLKLRFGAATIRCAGIANVATHPDYRRRGLAGRLMKDAFALMDREGMPVSLLSTGIPGYYSPFGYAPWETASVDLLKTGFRKPAPSGVRLLDRRDIPALNAVRRAYAAGFIGWHDRTDAEWLAQYAWIRHYPGEDESLALVAPAVGEPRAYVRVAHTPSHDLAQVIDFGALPESDPEVAALAGALIERAGRAGCRAVRVPRPCRDLITALHPHAETTAPRIHAEWMVRIGDLAGFLRALKPELSARALAAGIAGSVAVECGGKAALLTARNGAATVGPGPIPEDAPRAVLGVPEWTDVLMGVRPFSLHPFAARSRLGEREINLLDALFPRRDSLFWMSDAF